VSGTFFRSRCLYHLAFAAEWPSLKKYDKAKELYQYVFENCPDNDPAVDVYEDFVQDYPDYKLVAEAAGRLAEFRGAN